MSRVMHSVIADAPNNGQVLMLTVPADHKYEVLEAAAMVNPAGGAALFDYVVTAAGSLIATQTDPVPAGRYSARITYNALALLAGYTYSVGVIGSVGGAKVMLTYVDVDLTS